jgi:hypothetical protein
MEQIAEFIGDLAAAPLYMKVPLNFIRRSPPTSSTAAARSLASLTGFRPLYPTCAKTKGKIRHP